jgi:hypothetical protein
MSRILSFAAAMSIAILAGACTGQAVVSIADYYDTYNPRNFFTYHAGRDTELRVYGESSFGVNKKTLGDAVANAMYGQHTGRPARFMTTPGPGAEKNLYVIMAFNVEDSRDLCQTVGKLAPKPATGRTTLQGAWCWEQQTQSYVIAEIPAARPGEPMFTQLVGAVTRDLFAPNPDIELQEEGDDRPVP